MFTVYIGIFGIPIYLLKLNLELDFLAVLLRSSLTEDDSKGHQL